MSNKGWLAVTRGTVAIEPDDEFTPTQVDTIRSVLRRTPSVREVYGTGAFWREPYFYAATGLRVLDDLSAHGIDCSFVIDGAVVDKEDLDQFVRDHAIVILTAAVEKNQKGRNR